MDRAAAWLASDVTRVVPAIVAEHVGSTAVPGLEGKGVLDLAAEVAPAEMGATTRALLAAGWQRQAGAHAFPTTRPMLVASVEHDGHAFRTHLHLLQAESGELAELRAFRDALRIDADLRARYVARKREVLASGRDHGPDYAHAKSDVILTTLIAAGLREPH